MQFLPKLFALFVLFSMLTNDAEAVRGALFRSGRSIPFERAPGQQTKKKPEGTHCREVDLFVPCTLSAGRTCVIDRLCVHETPIVSVSIPSPFTKRMPLGASQIARNDFLRFGRSSRLADEDVKAAFLRNAGQPEIVYT